MQESTPHIDIDTDQDTNTNRNIATDQDIVKDTNMINSEEYKLHTESQDATMINTEIGNNDIHRNEQASQERPLMDNDFMGDYSFYTWYKGEGTNPYTFDSFHPLAAPFWEQERQFHLAYLQEYGSNKGEKEAYEQWKAEFLNQGLNNSHEDTHLTSNTNWTQAFETGKMNLPV